MVGVRKKLPNADSFKPGTISLILKLLVLNWLVANVKNYTQTGTQKK